MMSPGSSTAEDKEWRQLWALRVAGMGTFIWYPGEKRDELDPQMMRLLGLSQHIPERLSPQLAESIHADDRARYGEAIARASDPAGNKPFREDVRVVHPDNTEHWLTIMGQMEFAGEPPRPTRLLGVALDITKQKRTETALRTRAAEMAQIQCIGGIGGMVIDVAHGLVGYRSPEYLRLHGLPADLTYETHQDWLNRIHPEDRERAEKTLYTALAGSGSFYENEYRIIRPLDGQERWVAVRANIERNPKGQSLRLIGAHIDITERKRAEQALREAEERTRIAVDAAEMATWEWNLTTNQVYWNERHFLLFGLQPQSAPRTPEDFLRYVHPDDRPWLAKRLHEAVATGTAFDSEFRSLRADNDDVCWMSGYGRITGEANGLPTRMSGVMYDITPRKQVEQALRDSEARFRAVADLVPDLLWSADAEGNLVWFNQRWRDYTGQTLADATDHPWNNTIHPADRDESQSRFEQAIASGNSLVREHRMRRASDGQYRWFLVRAEPVRDEQGRINAWFGAATDIQEQRALRDTLEAQVEERTAELTETLDTLEAALEDRKRLLARVMRAQEEERRHISRELHDQTGQYLTGLSLDLRNLRDAVLNLPASAESEAEAPEPPLTPILAALDRLSVTNRLLSQDIHRLAVDLRPTSLDDVGLLPALQNYLEQWQERQAGTRIQVDAQFTGMDDGAKRLPGLIETVIYRTVQEALTNVAKYAASAAQVSVIVNQHHDHVRVIVEDDGPGFDPEAAARSGRLGLRGMQERAQMAGGELTIESSPGGGTTLFLELPVTEAKIAGDAARSPEMLQDRERHSRHRLYSAHHQRVAQVIEQANRVSDQTRTVIAQVQQRLQDQRRTPVSNE